MVNDRVTLLAWLAAPEPARHKDGLRLLDHAQWRALEALLRR